MKPHPANVPGDFYVEDGCCTLCGVPQVLAPELFSVIDDKAEHCYVRKQPSTAAERRHMLDTIWGAELECIHYRGTERAVQTQLVTLGVGAVCDSLPMDLRMRLRWQRVRDWLLLKLEGPK